MHKPIMPQQPTEVLKVPKSLSEVPGKPWAGARELTTVARLFYLAFSST
jgi:hypothetical protein